MRILCIVPAGPEADYLHKGLRELAYGVDVVHDLDDGLFYCTENRYDVVIAATEGVTQPIVERLVAAGAGASLIVIATEDSSTLRTAALRAGADTCLTRPWSFMELQARLQVLERRGHIQGTAGRTRTTSSAHAPQPTPAGQTAATGHAPDASASCDVTVAPLPAGRALQHEPVESKPARRVPAYEAVNAARPALHADAFRLDPSSRSLVATHASVPLSRREYLVLECLMRDPYAAISRDQLLAYAWTAEEHADASSVNTLISRLRAKANTSGVVLPLETVVGHGYRFFGPGGR
jgi:two-component system, OmpR family, response regulator